MNPGIGSTETSVITSRLLRVQERYIETLHTTRKGGGNLDERIELDRSTIPRKFREFVGVYLPFPSVGL